MLKHYWKTAVRSLLRSKLFTVINGIGLSIGIAIFLVLIGYVNYQFSFDKFYDHGDRIYRLNYFEYQGGQALLQSSRTHDRAALLLHEYAPEVQAVTRVFFEKAYVFNETTRMVDQDMLFVDSSFLKVFPVKVLEGSAETALVAPKSVMISQSQARIYFGDADPMGKLLYFNEHLPFIVTGVFEDIPNNTSMKFDFLLSWSTIVFYGWGSKDGSFESPSVITYVRLREHVKDINAVNAGLTRMANQHITTLKNLGHTARYELQPYQDLHVSQPLSGEIKAGVSKSLLYALILIAAFILVAAWVNYINLSIARSLERADEIGVRKVFGASRLIISGQFLMEAFILSLSTFAIGYGLYFLLTGPMSHLLFANLIFELNGMTGFVSYFLGFILATALFAIYPARLMSGFKPILILKNKMGSGKGHANIIHQLLMTFQFFLAVAIVGITLIAGEQLNFMRHFNSGFNIKHTIALSGPASTNSDSLRLSRFRSFRNEVLQNSAFVAGSASMNIPGQEIRYHDEHVHAVGSENIKKQSCWVMWIDEGYAPTFEIPFAQGRNFREQEKGNACLINETAAVALGYKNSADALNSKIITQEQIQYVIVGVLKDYHHESVRKPVDPILFFYRHPHEYGYYSFQIQTKNANSLKELEAIWRKHYPNDTFTPHFMDQYFEEQYQSDELFAKLLRVFSFISILIASLGLFGMASLSMVKRMKEIAVRKVLGASVLNILLLISKSYMKLIAIGCSLAFPVSWYVTNKWLSEFTYKINVHPMLIVFPGFIVLFTTLLTIGGMTLRAALTNPAKILKDQ